MRRKRPGFIRQLLIDSVGLVALVVAAGGAVLLLTLVQ